MPLKGYHSLCGQYAPRIVSEDHKNHQKHIGINKKKVYVTHYQIDGNVIKEGSRCDFLLINEEEKRAYFIELKGSDLGKAAEQLEATEKYLEKQLPDHTFYYRIIANKCKTQEIHSSKFRKYQIRWGKRLQTKTGKMEEEI